VRRSPESRGIGKGFTAKDAKTAEEITDLSFPAVASFAPFAVEALPIAAMSAITRDSGDLYFLRFLLSSVFQGFLKVRLK